jgi:hypothetical protein
MLAAGFVAIGGHVTALRCHIRHVVGVGAKEQVIGIPAWRVVAVVANEHAVRDGTVDKYPCETMRANHPAPV